MTCLCLYLCLCAAGTATGGSTYGEQQQEGSREAGVEWRGGGGAECFYKNL